MLRDIKTGVFPQNAQQGLSLPVAGAGLCLWGELWGNCHLQVRGGCAELHSRFLNGEQALKSLLHQRIPEVWNTPGSFSACLSRPWHRQRKDELEQRMSALQESRRELMVQLEGLMKLLKVRILLLERQHFPPFPACSGIPALLSHPKTLPEGQDQFAKSHSHPSSVWGAGGSWFSRFMWVKYPEPQIWSALTKLDLVTQSGAQPFPLSREINQEQGRM